MLAEKKAPDFIDVKRMGEAFELETVAEVEKYLSDIGLPVIPYNATMEELIAVQGNANNSYGKIKDIVAELRCQQDEKAHLRQQTYAKAYKYASERVSGATIAVLKMTADADPEVLKLDNEILEIKAKITILEARLDALRTTLQTVRQNIYALATLIQSGLY